MMSIQVVKKGFFVLPMLTLATFLAFLLAVLFLTISFDATTKATPELNHVELINLKKELSKSNPFKHQRQGLKFVSIQEKAANQGARIFLSNHGNTPVNIRFHDDYASISMSPRIPKIPINLFSNIHFLAKVENKKISLSNITIGLLPIPASIFNFIYPYIQDFLLEEYPEYYKLVSKIENVDFTEKKVSIHYRWDRQFAKQAQQFSKNMLLSSEEQELVAIYYAQLSKIPRFYLRIPTSIHKIIRPLFDFTKQRVSQGNAPEAEIRATLLTLGIFASGVRINRLIKGKNNQHLRHLYYGRLNLSGRNDLMRHFLISAALTVSTNKVLTDTIGFSKEVSDANGGSGFSFADLLADRAGVALAKFATDPNSATQFLNRITDPNLEASHFMPEHSDLPESLTAHTFKINYGDINSEKYQLMEKEITKRINALPIYLNL